MIKFHLLILAIGLFFSGVAKDLSPGGWEGKLQLNDSTFLSLNIVVSVNGQSLRIMNGEEEVLVQELKFNGDSVFIRMPVYDSEFRCKNFGDSLSGYWINYNRKLKNVLNFSASRVNGDRNVIKKMDPVPVGFRGNKWEVVFNPGSADQYKAVGIFNSDQQGNLTGTFLTETGDYRFLWGKLEESREGQYEIWLGRFDGSHTFLFKASVFKDGYNSVINGDFFSGAHWYTPFTGEMNEEFELRNPDSLTWIKPGAGKIDFSYKSTSGKTVSLSDELYRNKVVVIQIMGSWCPNCIDETKYFAGIYPQLNKKGLEVIGVSFEKNDDPQKSMQNLLRVKNRFQASYEFLLADLPASTTNASKAFPALNAVMSFPTTIYIDRKGVVRRIHTGFSGPATGSYYEHWKEETELFLEKLLAE